MEEYYKKQIIVQTAVIASIIWIIVGLTIMLIVNGNAYDRGHFEGQKALSENFIQNMWPKAPFNCTEPQIYAAMKKIELESFRQYNKNPLDDVIDYKSCQFLD